MGRYGEPNRGRDYLPLAFAAIRWANGRGGLACRCYGDSFGHGLRPKQKFEEGCALKPLLLPVNPVNKTVFFQLSYNVFIH